MTVRLGLVGAGAWGRHYVNAVNSIPGVEISAVCRKHPDLRPPGLPDWSFVTDDFDVLVRSCDGIIVATPPDAHVDYASFALKAGLPVLLEKPAAMNLTDTESIVEASKEAGATLLVNHVHLFSPGFSALRDFAIGLSIGSPIRVSSIAGNRGPVRPYSALLDWGPHDVAMVMSILGTEPSSVSVSEEVTEHGSVFAIVLAFGSSIASIRVGNGMDSKKRNFSVSSGGVSAYYDDLSDGKFFISRGPSQPFIPQVIDPSPPLTAVVKSFVSCIVSGYSDWRYSTSLVLGVARVLESFRTA